MPSQSQQLFKACLIPDVQKVKQVLQKYPFLDPRQASEQFVGSPMRYVEDELRKQQKTLATLDTAVVKKYTQQRKCEAQLNALHAGSSSWKQMGLRSMLHYLEREIRFLHENRIKLQKTIRDLESIKKLLDKKSTTFIQNPQNGTQLLPLRTRRRSTSSH